MRPFTIVERAGVRDAVIGLAAILAPHLLPARERDLVAVTIGDHALRALVRRFAPNTART